MVVDNHQATVMETSGVIGGISCLMLFDLGVSNSFISPFLVE